MLVIVIVQYLVTFNILCTDCCFDEWMNGVPTRGDQNKKSVFSIFCGSGRGITKPIGCSSENYNTNRWFSPEFQRVHQWNFSSFFCVCACVCVAIFLASYILLAWNFVLLSHQLKNLFLFSFFFVPSLPEGPSPYIWSSHSTFFYFFIFYFLIFLRRVAFLFFYSGCDLQLKFRFSECKLSL